MMNIVFIVLLAGGLCALFGLRLLGGVNGARSSGREGGLHEGEVVLNPGPWGRVVCSSVYLEAPAELLEQFPMPNTATYWVLEGFSEVGFRALLVKAGLGGEAVAKLGAPENMRADEGALVVSVPLAELESITPEERAVIYRELAKSERNTYHKDPVFISSGDVGEWFRNSGVRPELEEKIRRLCYPRGDGLAFSDVSALLGYAESDSEARQLFRLCSRTRALIARLRVDAGADHAALREYWSNQFHFRESLPLLDSFLESEAVELDVSHLMPAGGRKLLYSFPTLGTAAGGRLPDCHWTSLNFFSAVPQDLYRDTRMATSKVLESYVRVEGAWRFGDVLMFVEAQTGGALHSCVYLADDLVFTKNGDNLLTPWILVRISDLKQVYFSDRDGTVQAYRRKVDLEPVASGS